MTKIALICLWHTPNAPINAADPKIMRQTRAHDIDRFCIPIFCYKKSSKIINMAINFMFYNLLNKIMQSKQNCCAFKRENKISLWYNKMRSLSFIYSLFFFASAIKTCQWNLLWPSAISSKIIKQHSN